MMVFKEKGEPVPGKKPLEAYRIQRTVNKIIHCTFIGISPPQNLRLLEDKKFVSHSPSEKEKKTSVCTEKKDRSTIGILCNLDTPQLNLAM